MKRSVLRLLTVASLVSFCIAVGPFDPENETNISPQPTYHFDGRKKDFREGDIFKPIVSDLFGDAATVGKEWKNGRIPYVIDCSLKNMPTALAALKEAIEAWESRTCIRFIPKEESDKFFVTFLRSSGCWASHVGFQGGSSVVSIGNGCEYKHVMVHELGHVIGFWHEQSRPDRDNYVSVVRSNIIPSLLYNFDKVTSKTQTHGEAYDFESIMHYPLNAFAIDRKRKTLLPRKNLGDKRPYVKLSDSDVIQANKMYKCGRTHGVPLGDAKQRDDACVDDKKYCGDWARHNHCELNPEPLLVYCKRSCENCGPCVNKPGCPESYTYEFCSKQATVALRDCKALCRVCEPESTPKPPTPATIKPLLTVQPTTEQTTTEQTTTEQTTTEQTTTEQTTTEQTTTEQTTTEQTTTEQTTTEQTTTEQTTTEQPTTEQPTTEQTLVPSSKEIVLPGKKLIGVICVDRSEFCAEWKRDGRCEKDDWVKQNCLVTCGRVDICDVEPPTPTGTCAKPLGLSSAYKDVQTILDRSFRASSAFYPGGGWRASAGAGRLYITDDHTRKTVGAWCSDPQATKNSWLEVDLGQAKRVTGVATQGRDVYFEHVRSYEIAYKLNGSDEWKFYSIAGETKVLTGNCDHLSPVFNILEDPITARFVRIRPKTFRGAPCLRVELYGCDA